jgi:tetratricopeptide (TPR) repeat protein
LAGAEVMVLGAQKPGKKVKAMRSKCEPQKATVQSAYPSGAFPGVTFTLDSETPQGMSGRAVVLDGKLVILVVGRTQDSRYEFDDVATLVTKEQLASTADYLALSDWSDLSKKSPRGRALHAFYRNRADCQEQDRETLLQAIEEDPTLGAAYIRSGICDAVQDKALAAARLIQQGLEFVSDPTMLFLLGRLYESSSEPDKAELAYRRALELRPDFHDARLALGISCAAQGQPSEAVGQLRLLFENVPHWEESVMKILEDRFPLLVEAMRKQLEQALPDE